jgi:hypothetical protein
MCRAFERSRATFSHLPGYAPADEEGDTVTTVPQEGDTVTTVPQHNTQPSAQLFNFLF